MLTKSDAGGRGGLKTSKIGWHNMWTAPNWKGAEYSWGGWGCRKSTTDRFLWSPPPRPRCSSASNISIAKLLFRKDITFAQPWSSDPIDPHRYLLHSWWIFGYQKVSTGNVPKNHQIQTENEKLTRDIDLCIMTYLLLSSLELECCLEGGNFIYHRNLAHHLIHQLRQELFSSNKHSLKSLIFFSTKHLPWAIFFGQTIFGGSDPRHISVLLVFFLQYGLSKNRGGCPAQLLWTMSMIM